MKLYYIIIPLIAIAVAGLGSLLTNTGLTPATDSVLSWYQTIQKPNWTPAGSIIGVVWTTIFILTAISALIVWTKAPRDSRLTWIAVLFLVNAAFNVLWSFLFFNQHLLAVSIFEAALLGLSVMALIILIWPISRWASILLIPYAGWVIFATYLTYSVWLLNK